MANWRSVTQYGRQIGAVNRSLLAAVEVAQDHLAGLELVLAEQDCVAGVLLC